jgi:quinol monooxygenase YgiN
MRTLIIAAAALIAASCCPKTDKTAEAQAPAQKQIEMIRLNVPVTTTAENLPVVVEGLNALAAASRAEEGCVGYEIYQSTVEPTRLMIVETWASDEALTAHQATEHYTTILPALEGKMSITLERFEK